MERERKKNGEVREVLVTHYPNAFRSGRLMMPADIEAGSQEARAYAARHWKEIDFSGIEFPDTFPEDTERGAGSFTDFEVSEL